MWQRIPLNPYENKLFDFIQPTKVAVLKNQGNWKSTFSSDMRSPNSEFWKAIGKKRSSLQILNQLQNFLYDKTTFQGTLFWIMTTHLKPASLKILKFGVPTFNPHFEKSGILFTGFSGKMKPYSILAISISFIDAPIIKWVFKWFFRKITWLASMLLLEEQDRSMLVIQLNRVFQGLNHINLRFSHH